MNSVVPKVFGSMTPPQLGLSVTVRCGPTPLRQWYSSEAPAGPAHVRHFYRFERSDDIIANPARVRNFGVRADPDSFVNTVAEVLCKLAEEIAVNLRTGLGNVNKQCNFLCSRHRRSHSHSEQGQAGKK